MTSSCGHNKKVAQDFFRRLEISGLLQIERVFHIMLLYRIIYDTALHVALCMLFADIKMKANIPEVTKTGLANLTSCVTFHNFSRPILACLCTVQFKTDFGFFSLLSD